MTSIAQGETPEQVLLALGLALPEPPAAVGAYLPWQRLGRIVTTSFQLPWHGSTLAATGLVGREVTLAQAIAAARQCALNGLAQLRQAAGGDLKRVRIVRIDGHVGCIAEFTQIPKVLDGASVLINEVLGERGRHARTALGHGVMPLNVPVMLGFLAEVDEG
jgi:enamine deaminase RidA (YjgF/YER057c/UK114 family)